MTNKVTKKGRAATKKTRRRRPMRTHGGGIFERDFFERVLPALVASCPKPEGTKPVVTISLGDGTDLDCCGIMSFEERYVVLACYEGVGEDGIPRTADDVGLEAVPYELVLRCTVRPEERSKTSLGFGEVPKTKKG